MYNGRATSMFSMTPISGGSTIYLPNPDVDSGVALISTLVNAGRNALGEVIAQKIGRDQVKSELAWNFLLISEWEPLLRFWNDNFFFMFTYYDRVAGTTLTRECYIGDRSDRPFAIDANGKPTAYVDCKANIIDTGRSA